MSNAKRVVVGRDPAMSIELAEQYQAIHLQLDLNYRKLLEEMVFCQDVTADRVTAEQYRRYLSPPQARQILGLVWKRRDGRLTAWSLATKLAPAPKDVAKLNSRIRNIGISAAAYGLVSRLDMQKKAVDLQGTEFLNDFFVALSEMHEQTWNEFLSYWDKSR
jgi:hypothetical protein